VVAEVQSGTDEERKLFFAFFASGLHTNKHLQMPGFGLLGTPLVHSLDKEE
jgi:hypothetical protein